MEYMIILHSWEIQDNFEASYPAFVASYSPHKKRRLGIKKVEESENNKEHYIESDRTFSVNTKNGEDAECKLKTECDHIDSKDNSPSITPVSLTKTDGKPAFTCETCGKSFSRQWNLKSHNKRVHIGERPYACSSCDKTFKTSYDRAKHEIIHQKCDKPYKCNKCSRSFHCPALLEEHDYIHTGVSKHYCDQCGMSFSCKYSVERHKTRTHSTQVNISAKSPKAASKLKCGTCGKVFKQWNEYEAHCNFHSAHVEGSVKSSKATSKLECKKCGKFFMRWKDYEDHCNFHCYFKALEVVRAQKLGLKKAAT